MEFKQKNLYLLFPIFAFVFILIYTFAFDVLQFKSYNILTSLTSKQRIASSDTVLVVIDDKSLKEIGRWPWKRTFYLEIFDFFENYTNAKLMAYDGLITAPNNDNPEDDEIFFNDIKKFKKLNTAYAFSYEELGSAEDRTFYDNLLKEKSKINIIDKRKNKVVSDFSAFTALQKKYFKNVNSVGFVNVIEDKDGYVRRIPQLISYNNVFYPSLSFLVFQKYSKIRQFILTDNYIYGISNDYTVKIPTKNEKGIISNYINYYNSENKKYSHLKYSAADIINSYRLIKQGKKSLIDPGVFDKKIVFIGANANAQALADVAATPISDDFAGVDIQATNFDNLLNNQFFKIPSKIYEVLICILICVFIFFMTYTLSPAAGLLGAIFAALIYFVFSVFMYSNRIAINFLLPELYIIIAIACTYSYKYLIEDFKKKKIQSIMGKYLSYDVMQNVVKNIDNIELGGKRANVSVLFADIRNFTSISENMDPNSVTMILNEYFSALVPIIEEHNGVLNKFMGDAVLAIFGEPKKSNNHALDAVRCGYKMLKKVKYLQDKWLDEGKPKIETGVGIATGVAFIGNIGSSDRLEYTVIGDTVNTASRIENYNKVYKTNFLISESTYKEVQSYVDAITIKNVAIRGKLNKINLYEVVRLLDKDSGT